MMRTMNGSSRSKQSKLNKLVVRKSYLLRLWRTGPAWRSQQVVTLICITNGEQHHFSDLGALLAFLAAQEVTMD